jgi:NTE family protein
VAPTATRHSVSDPRRTTPVAATKAETSNRDRVLIDFALQGGGAHGAFTWGALDRLLEDSWLQIDGISGTSAGAMKGDAGSRRGG